MLPASRPSQPRLAIGARLVGRNSLLQQLASVAKEVVEGQSRIVTLVGGEGIGKARIASEFIDRTLTTGPLPFVIYAAPARVGRTKSVVGRLLLARFSLAESTSIEQARGQILNEVARVLGDKDVADVCYFLGQLLDLPFRATPLTRAVADDPAEAMLVRRAILRRFVEADAAAQPVCLFVQQLEAADEDSLELLQYLAHGVRGRVLILCTARPNLLGQRRSWFDFGAERHVRMDVEGLDTDAATELGEALLSRCSRETREPLVEAAVALARGNPALLERVVRIYHDLGVIEAGDDPSGEGTWKVNVERLGSVRLPMTAEDTITARISALSLPERRVLEHAATMGSIFWLEGLVVLARMDQPCPDVWNPTDVQDIATIRSLLEDLERRDYILSLPESALLDDREFVWKHTLEREKIAALTPTSTVRRHHLAIADWLLVKKSVREHEETCAMLAQHLERGGSRTRAGLLFLEAADLGRHNHAARRACDNYERGLSLIGESDAVRRIDALHNYGDTLLMLGKTDEALTAFRAMLELGYRLNRLNKGGAAHNRIGRLYRESGALGQAKLHIEAGLALFEATGDERGVAASHDDIGKLLWITGDYPSALCHQQKALRMRESIGDPRSIALSLNNIGLVWMDQGSTQQAREAFEASLKLRREALDTVGTAESLTNLGCLAQDQNDWERALVRFEEAYQLIRGIGERNRVAGLLTHIGTTQYHLGRTKEAIEVLMAAEELCDELGDRLHLAEALRALAKAYLLHGQLDRARENIKHAVDLFGQVRSKPHLAIALRTLAEVTAAGAWGDGHEDRVVDYFMRSIAICREIGNELEVARSYRAFSVFVLSRDSYKKNAAIVREAVTLGGMADEIFERQRIALASSSGALRVAPPAGSSPSRSRPG